MLKSALLTLIFICHWWAKITIFHHSAFLAILFSHTQHAWDNRKNSKSGKRLFLFVIGFLFFCFLDHSFYLFVWLFVFVSPLSGVRLICCKLLAWLLELEVTCMLSVMIYGSEVRPASAESRQCACRIRNRLTKTKTKKSWKILIVLGTLMDDFHQVHFLSIRGRKFMVNRRTVKHYL